MHSDLAPSSAGIWVHCTGWPNMVKQCPPQPPTQDSLEGDGSHWLAAAALMGWLIDGGALDDTNGTRKKCVGKPVDGGAICTEEMFDGALMFAEHVVAIIAKQPQRTPVNLHIEEQVSIACIHPKCFGTPDAWYYSPDTRRLYVFDYKFGHLQISPNRNWQLLTYSNGIIDQHKIPTDRLTIHLVIVQPRSYHSSGPIREWIVKPDELADHRATLVKAANVAMGSSPFMQSGSWCRNCDASGRCTAAGVASMQGVDVALTGSTVDVLDARSLSAELGILTKAADAIKYRMKGLTKEAEARMRSGERIPGYEMKHGVGNRAWTRSPATVRLTAGSFGVDVDKPGLITPKQAITAGMPADVVKSISGRPTRAAELKLIDLDEVVKLFGPPAGGGESK